MVLRGSDFGKSLHLLAVVIPWKGEDDERFVRMAYNHLATRYEQVAVGDGFGRWTDNDGYPVMGKVVVVSVYPAEITELDLSTIYGVGLLVHLNLGRKGVAVIVDNDVLTF